MDLITGKQIQAFMGLAQSLVGVAKVGCGVVNGTEFVCELETTEDLLDLYIPHCQPDREGHQTPRPLHDVFEEVLQEMWDESGEEDAEEGTVETEKDSDEDADGNTEDGTEQNEEENTDEEAEEQAVEQTALMSPADIAKLTKALDAAKPTQYQVMVDTSSPILRVSKTMGRPDRKVTLTKVESKPTTTRVESESTATEAKLEPIPRGPMVLALVWALIQAFPSQPQHPVFLLSTLSFLEQFGVHRFLENSPEDATDDSTEPEGTISWGLHDWVLEETKREHEEEIEKLRQQYEAEITAVERRLKGLKADESVQRRRFQKETGAHKITRDKLRALEREQQRRSDESEATGDESLKREILHLKAEVTTLKKDKHFLLLENCGLANASGLPREVEHVYTLDEARDDLVRIFRRDYDLRSQETVALNASWRRAERDKATIIVRHFHQISAIQRQNITANEEKDLAHLKADQLNRKVGRLMDEAKRAAARNSELSKKYFALVWSTTEGHFKGDTLFQDVVEQLQNCLQDNDILLDKLGKSEARASDAEFQVSMFQRKYRDVEFREIFEEQRYENLAARVQQLDLEKDEIEFSLETAREVLADARKTRDEYATQVTSLQAELEQQRESHFAQLANQSAHPAALKYQLQYLKQKWLQEKAAHDRTRHQIDSAGHEVLAMQDRLADSEESFEYQVERNAHLLSRLELAEEGWAKFGELRRRIEGCEPIGEAARLPTEDQRMTTLRQTNEILLRENEGLNRAIRNWNIHLRYQPVQEALRFRQQLEQANTNLTQTQEYVRAWMRDAEAENEGLQRQVEELQGRLRGMETALRGATGNG
ncbi:MAG: hypothetical protein M1823_001462 [Watsoniomyces obsoletus]|nr:MAG: hypothetical protein M1823_001462 [Watsoniomyces obsoletus]